MIRCFVNRFVFGGAFAILLNSVAFSAPFPKQLPIPLQVQLSSEPTQYDPLFLEDGSGLKLSANVLGTLFYYDGKGERQKGLLRDYSVSRDRKTYTFRFHPGMKWSDGKPFHADQFILALRRLTDEPIKGALANLFPAIQWKETRVLSPESAEVTLRAQDEQFPNLLTLPPFAPIRPDLIEVYQKKRTPVVPTLGAYEIVEYKRDSHLLLRKNANFHAARDVGIEEVKVRFITEEAALPGLMKTGSIDILTRVPALQYEAVVKLARVVDVPVEAVTYLAFNLRKPPFDRVEMRTAVRDAIGFDQRVELSNILRTGEFGARTFLPSILDPSVRSPEPLPAPVKTDPPLQFTLQSDKSSRNDVILQFVQNEIKKEIGGQVKLEALDWKAHYAKLKSDPAGMFRFGWQNPVSDPSIVYDVLTSKSPNNFTGWSNPDYDEKVAMLRQEPRRVKRSKLIQELEEILRKEAPVVPVLHQVLRFGVSKRVSGFRANPFGVILFRELRLNDSPGPKD
jgi:oligopeptide transport system substrate-binding protein